MRTKEVYRPTGIRKTFIIIGVLIFLTILMMLFISYLKKPTIINNTAAEKNIIQNVDLTRPSYNFISEGNYVYFNDSKVYIICTESVNETRPYADCNVTSKVYTGNADLVLGVDTNKFKPAKAEYYKPSIINDTFGYLCTGNFNYTLNPKIAYCYETNGTLSFSHAFDWGNLTEKTIYWNISREQHYKDISGAFESINYNYGEMNKWYYLRNFPVVANQTYSIRLWFYIYEATNSKYWFAIKPSSETIQEAITNNHLYALDPFVNSTGGLYSTTLTNKSLIVFYSFNKFGEIRDDIRYKKNTTIFSNLAWNTTFGLMNTSLYLNATTNGNSFVLNETVNDDILSSAANYSINLWVYWLPALTEAGSGRIFDDNGAAQSYINTATNYLETYNMAGSAGHCVTNNTIVQSIWTMITYTCLNGNDLKIYLNNTLVCRNTTSSCAKWSSETNMRFFSRSASNFRYFGGNADNLFIFNESLSQGNITSLYNSGLGVAWNETPFSPAEPEGLTMTLNSPVHHFNSSISNVTFNCTFNATSPTLNLTLIIDDADNYTIYNTTASQNLSIQTSLLLSEGEHLWNCRGATDLNSTTSVQTRDLKVDLTAPILNITYPLNTTYTDTSVIFENRKEIQVNYTLNELLPNTCVLWNGTANVTLTCYNNYTLNISYGAVEFIIWANDSFNRGNSSKVNSVFAYKVIENSQNYSPVTYGGSMETFTANISLFTGYSVSSAVLVYNNTRNVGSTATAGANIILTKNGLVTPSVTANKTFYWEVTLNDGSIYNLTAYNQSLIKISVDNCTTTSKRIYNFSLKDEKEQTTAADNISIETALNLYSYDRSLLISSYNKSVNTSYSTFCISQEFGSSNYTLDVIVKYSYLDHEPEYYNIVNATIRNNTGMSSITLYDLATAQSTNFEFTFTNVLGVADALVYVYRQYIPENNFKIVELPKTDTEGKTNLHLVRNEIIYNFLIMKDGVVLGVYNNSIAFCDDYTIGNCKISLSQITTNEDLFNFDNVTGLNFSSPSYDNSTRTVSFTFLTYDGSIKNVMMEVLKNDIAGNRSVCNNTLNASTGTLSCVVPASVSNSELIVKIYVNGKEIFRTIIIIIYEGFGKTGNFLFFIYLLAFVILFAKSKNTILMGVLLGFITSIGLGLIKGAVIGLASAGVWLLVVVAISMWKVNKNKEG